MKTLKDFTSIYSLSKTIRLGLAPLGMTLEHIERNGLIVQDQYRADSYQQMKKLIDGYHKAYIDRVLSNFHFQLDSCGNDDSLEEYFLYYHLSVRDEKRADALEKVSGNLRMQIARRLTDDAAFKRIDKRELITKDLLDFVTSEKDKQLIEEFKDFTTYFTGFHENRRNMYSGEAKSTAIAYRVVHENLPKFIDNMDIFAKVLAVPEMQEDIQSVYADYKEFLHVGSINDLFKLDYFDTVITQKQITVYNLIIGGRTEEDGKKKLKGLNEYINLYNQRQKNKHARLPKLKTLFKQILSDREALSWLPEKFEDSNQLLESVELCYENVEALWSNSEESVTLVDLLLNLSSYDLSKIYITSDESVAQISRRLYGRWDLLRSAVENDYVSRFPRKPKETEEKFTKRKEKYYKSFNSFSIAYLNQCVAQVADKDEAELPKVEEYFKTLGCKDGATTIFDVIETTYREAKELLNTPYPSDKNLAQDKGNVEKVKNLLDSLKSLQKFVAPLLGKGDESDKDEKFYGELIPLWKLLDAMPPLYNKVRNYMTQKPYSEEKIKMNFENSTLLDGWDLNKEVDNFCVILRKDGLYYLAIMNKKHNKVFLEKNLKDDGDCYEKMEYKLLPGANKMFPHVFFASSRKDEFAPDEEILDAYNRGTHKKGKNFSLADCHRLIDFFKSSINKHPDWKKFNFNFSETRSYEDMSGFYREVDQQGYKLSFRNVSVSYIHSLVDEGKLYLFQIYNKDFSAHSKGTPNLHTLYWKALFDEENLKDVVYKLNGQAEIFFRKSSISYHRPTHPAGQSIANKNKLGRRKESLFAYDLIKDRRYTVDHFQLHVPITMNFKSTGSNNINPLVHQYLKHTDDIRVIGIDRGERHLLYLSLINGKGEIVKQFSLNEVRNEFNGEEYLTDYHSLLEARQAERDKARKSWKTIEGIKNLKEGYLSRIVHDIAQLVVEHNAIVALEDLNQGFMRGRQKVEAQVYQKFEKMLIDKLNYLVDKQLPATAPGGVLHALQLTNKFESFKKMGKQSGILFYVPAWNTSKIDPVTGFVNLFDTRYTTMKKAQEFFGKFDSIGYNVEKNWFEFEFDYNKFTAKAEDTRTRWKLCSHGTRIVTFRNVEANNRWDNKEVVLTELLKSLFEQYNIPLTPDMKSAICGMDKSVFFKELLNLMRLLLQLRNSRTGELEDYILSPVADEQGVFFDSREYDGRDCDNPLPKNADANGAYNIARKGLWVIKQIRQTEDLKKLKLAMSNKEWLNFAQTKPYLND